METNNTPEKPSIIDGIKHHHSKTFVWIVLGLAELIIIIGVFALGMNVGLHKANYTYMWAKNYTGNFGQPGAKGLAQVPPPPGQFFNDRGLDGTVLSIDKNSVVIKDEDGNEKTILIDPQTTIRQGSSNIPANGLTTSQEIVVIGEPNSLGQIDAKFIRVLSGQ